MNTFEPLVTLQCSIQRALRAEVTDRVIAVTCGLEASVVRAKAAMRGHFKTGHMKWPGT